MNSIFVGNKCFEMNRTKHILKEKGVPQQEFVDSLDLSRSAIVKMLAGTSSQGTFESKLSYVAIICSSRRYTVLTRYNRHYLPSFL